MLAAILLLRSSFSMESSRTPWAIIILLLPTGTRLDPKNRSSIFLKNWNWFQLARGRGWCGDGCGCLGLCSRLKVSGEKDKCWEEPRSWKWRALLEWDCIPPAPTPHTHHTCVHTPRHTHIRISPEKSALAGIETSLRRFGCLCVNKGHTVAYQGEPLRTKGNVKCPLEDTGHNILSHPFSHVLFRAAHGGVFAGPFPEGTEVQKFLVLVKDT